MDVRGNIDVHADIEILELGADQGADAGATDSAGERASGYRHAVADAQRGFFVIQSANLGVLQELGVAVARQGRERTTTHAQHEIPYRESAGGSAGSARAAWRSE